MSTGITSRDLSHYKPFAKYTSFRTTRFEIFDFTLNLSPVEVARGLCHPLGATYEEHWDIKRICSTVENALLLSLPSGHFTRQSAAQLVKRHNYIVSAWLTQHLARSGIWLLYTILAFYLACYDVFTTWKRKGNIREIARTLPATVQLTLMDSKWERPEWHSYVSNVFEILQSGKEAPMGSAVVYVLWSQQQKQQYVGKANLIRQASKSCSYYSGAVEI